MRHLIPGFVSKLSHLSLSRPKSQEYFHIGTKSLSTFICKQDAQRRISKSILSFALALFRLRQVQHLRTKVPLRTPRTASERMSLRPGLQLSAEMSEMPCAVTGDLV
jgi:hypothetical protein